MKLKNKVAIITGSSRGIGREIAILFAEEGASVVINCVENIAEGEKVTDIIGKKKALFVQADVTTESGAKYLVSETEKRFGKIDILVNNAGRIFRPRDWKMDIDTWHKTIEANLTSAWLMIKEASPLMIRAKGGTIVNIISIYGFDGPADTLAYSVAKGGLITLTKSLARELAPIIRVNGIAPGNVITQMTKESGRKVVELFNKKTPLKRSATPEEIANAALFLASAESSYITGEILVVDGGYSLR